MYLLGKTKIQKYPTRNCRKRFGESKYGTNIGISDLLTEEIHFEDRKIDISKTKRISKMAANYKWVSIIF